MKHLKFYMVLCCFSIVFAACVKQYNPNNETKDHSAKQNNTELQGTTGIENGHAWVDLGLPNGLKWATCNVGADKPEAHGDYFAWGEVATKTIYNWSNYKHGFDCNKLTTYCIDAEYGVVDNKIILKPEDDVACVRWGDAWRMPTNEEWAELRKNCTWTWLTRNKVEGYEVKGPNGNCIFLPAAGSRYDDYLHYAGNNGYYWASSLDSDYPDDAWYVYFCSDWVLGGSGYRYYGLSVRPVLKK